MLVKAKLVRRRDRYLNIWGQICCIKDAYISGKATVITFTDGLQTIWPSESEIEVIRLLKPEDLGA